MQETNGNGDGVWKSFALLPIGCWDGSMRPEGSSLLWCRGQVRWAGYVTFSASLECVLSSEQCCSCVVLMCGTSECGPGFHCEAGEGVLPRRSCWLLCSAGSRKVAGQSSCSRCCLSRQRWKAVVVYPIQGFEDTVGVKCRITEEMPSNTKHCQCHFFLFFPPLPPSFPEVPRVLVCARRPQLLVGWGEIEGLGHLVSHCSDAEFSFSLCCPY